MMAITATVGAEEGERREWRAWGAGWTTRRRGREEEYSSPCSPLQLIVNPVRAVCAVNWRLPPCRSSSCQGALHEREGDGLALFDSQLSWTTSPSKASTTPPSTCLPLALTSRMAGVATSSLTTLLTVSNSSPWLSMHR